MPIESTPQNGYATDLAPKPFVFVVMPFAPEFDDIFTFGIKGSVEDVGAYAERVDEQHFTESILDRIVNQISKADVIVADVSGKNPNVCYEIGYAHALGKPVLLVTKDVNDIPFDLRHRPHTVYDGRATDLRAKLKEKLKWAITEASCGRRTLDVPLAISVNDIPIPIESKLDESPVVRCSCMSGRLAVRVQIENTSSEELDSITHIYLWLPNNTMYWVQYYQAIREVIPSPVKTHAPPIDNIFGTQFRLPRTVPPLPPGAIETTTFEVGAKESPTPTISARLTVHLHNRWLTYNLRLRSE